MMDDQQVAVFEAKLADLMDADVEHFKATRYRDEDGWVGYDGLGQWYSELADTLAMMAAAAWQAAKADSAQGAEPVAYPDCDTCGGSMNYMPWHYATETERHLHACNECCPKVNPAHPAAKVPEETEAMVDAAVKVFEDAGVAVDLGWLGEACRAYVAAASATPQQSGEWMRCLCGSEPELEVYEPCDDHPGNACANWCVICECPKCGARPKPLGKRFSTEDEAYNAGKAQWKKFISGLTQPSKDKQEGDV